jgi:hypothetical protein
VKNHTKQNQKAASTAGNCNKQQTGDPLCDAWLAFHASRDRAALEKLADEVDRELKRLARRLRSPLLDGREDDVRQRAALLVLGTYLPGNSDLSRATRSLDVPAVMSQLRRSLAGAIRTAKFAVGAEIKRERKLFADYDPRLHEKQALCLHPSQREHVWDLPFDAQRALVLMLLEKGMADEALDAQGGEIARLIISDGLNQSAAGAELGLSRRSAHAKLQPVRSYLRRKIGEAEFPMP